MHLRSLAATAALLTACQPAQADVYTLAQTELWAIELIVDDDGSTTCGMTTTGRYGNRAAAFSLYIIEDGSAATVMSVDAEWSHSQSAYDDVFVDVEIDQMGAWETLGHVRYLPGSMTVMGSVNADYAGTLMQEVERGNVIAMTAHGITNRMTLNGSAKAIRGPFAECVRRILKTTDN